MTVTAKTTTAAGVDLGFDALEPHYDKDAAIVEDFRDAEAVPWKSSLVRLYDEVCELGLERNVVELDLFGYTIVEPQKVATPEFIDRVAQASLDMIERRRGMKADLETGFDDPDALGPFRGVMMPYILFDDPVYEEVIMNPIALALSSYLLGYHCALDATWVWAKQDSPDDSPMWDINSAHIDTRIPGPLPAYAQLVNVTWPLTDYSREDGGVVFVPGSHKLGRKPNRASGEGKDELISVECPKGSLVVWSGMTWHGTIPRTNPGMRMNLIITYKRPYLPGTEQYRNRAPQAVLDRNPPRFRTLMGEIHHPNPDAASYSLY